jgi:hypothetical protein
MVNILQHAYQDHEGQRPEKKNDEKREVSRRSMEVDRD